MHRPVKVVTGGEAAEQDARTIRAGVPSRALMQRAGAAAAAELSIRLAPLLDRGVLVFAGPGNNGGDAWVVARALARAGTRVRVCEPVPARSEDAIAERALALDSVELVSLDRLRPPLAERVVVDGLLGTGSNGEPRGEIASAIDALVALRENGARIVAIDLPSGVDATTGESQRACPAALTMTFGSIKRGHLVTRSMCGRVVAVDIGFTDADLGIDLVDAQWAAGRIPRIAAEAHKGTRGKVAVIGGDVGMAGAAILAARAAQRSGAGMVKIVVTQGALPVVQRAEPAALAAVWNPDDYDWIAATTEWADAIAIGPGLGAGAGARGAVERLLERWDGPIVVDADALNVFAGDVDALAPLLRGKRAVITPHPLELSRLIGVSPDEVLGRRFEVGGETASRLGAAVLLKGVPTIVSAQDGRRLACASGTPALATAGSGDLLCGMIATLLAQTTLPAAEASATGAFVHGRSAEIASDVATAGTGRVRGVTLDDILVALPAAWNVEAHALRYPVLVELPEVGDAPV